MIAITSVPTATMLTDYCHMSYRQLTMVKLRDHAWLTI